MLRLWTFSDFCSRHIVGVAGDDIMFHILVSELPSCCLPVWYHINIWQVSPQLSCGDTWQIWTWFEVSNIHFCRIKISHNREINKRSFSNPTPGQYSVFVSRVTLKFDGWPWITKGHLFYVASSFMHDFIAISELKLKLQSGNAQFGSKSAIFCVSCDLEIWQMTLKNNRAPLLCYFKLCASFYSHQWIQTGVTVPKRPIWVKFNDFLSRVTLKFDGWPWKTIGHLSEATSSFMHHFIICEFKLELQSGNR